MRWTHSPEQPASDDVDRAAGGGSSSSNGAMSESGPSPRGSNASGLPADAAGLGDDFGADCTWASDSLNGSLKGSRGARDAASIMLAVQPRWDLQHVSCNVAGWQRRRCLTERHPQGGRPAGKVRTRSHFGPASGRPTPARCENRLRTTRRGRLRARRLRLTDVQTEFRRARAAYAPLDAPPGEANA